MNMNFNMRSNLLKKKSTVSISSFLDFLFFLCSIRIAIHVVFFSVFSQSKRFGVLGHFFLRNTIHTQMRMPVYMCTLIIINTHPILLTLTSTHEELN